MPGGAPVERDRERVVQIEELRRHRPAAHVHCDRPAACGAGEEVQVGAATQAPLKVSCRAQFGELGALL